jgi:hypothetical protein
MLDRRLRNYRGLEVEEIGRELDGFMYDNFMHPFPAGYDANRATYLCLQALYVCQVQGIYPELAEDLDAFMQVIRVCIERYEASEEEKPITAAEIRERYHIPERPLHNAFAIIGLVGLTSTSNPSTHDTKAPVDWSFTVFWTIRKYRDVETIEDVVAVREKLLEHDRKQIASNSPLTTIRQQTNVATIPRPALATSAADAQPGEPAPAPPSDANSGSEYEYAVAISFAGPQRELAERLARLVRKAGYKVFYDDFYPDRLWGKDLPPFFDGIYRKKSLFCVLFISQEYAARMWTNWERRSATARLLEERGKEYILPIRVEDVEVEGIPSTIGYVSLRDHSIEQTAEMLIKKLQRANAPRATPAQTEETPNSTPEKELQPAQQASPPTHKRQSAALPRVQTGKSRFDPNKVF